tara:strand:- start:9300 stop:9572 length:273 start_codon:yes stop_codon:yes gene_type:complete
MTEKEMNKLADVIVKKIIDKQAEYDAQFMQEVKQVSEENLVNEDADVAAIKLEIFKLEVLIEYLLEEELYERAHVISEEIDKLRSSLEKI